MNQDFIVHKKAISCFVFLICLPCISCGTYCNEDKCCVVAYPAADFCVAWLVNLISGVIIIIFCFFVSLARDKGIIGRGHDLRLLACLLSLFTFARIACLLQLWIKTSDLDTLFGRRPNNKVQTLTTKDCKGPQTNMPEKVGSIKTWSAKMKSRHIKFCKQNTAILIVRREN